MPRPSTPDRIMPSGGRRITVKRCCNGCFAEIGDVSDMEMQLAIAGRPLPDVREECGCLGQPVGDTETNPTTQTAEATR